MKLPKRAHTSHPWRIHEVARDFHLEDVWALPTPGGPDDFQRLVHLVAAFDPAKASPLVVRTLFTARRQLGALLGIDDPKTGLGARVSSLRNQLPRDLRDGPSGPDSDALPFSPLYLTHNEWALEIANQTVHGVLHFGWVEDADGYCGQMAVLVKRNGLLGAIYMLAIAPFRYLLYPVMLREIELQWRALVCEPAV